MKLRRTKHGAFPLAAFRQHLRPRVKRFHISGFLMRRNRFLFCLCFLLSHEPFYCSYGTKARRAPKFLALSIREIENMIRRTQEAKHEQVVASVTWSTA